MDADPHPPPLFHPLWRSLGLTLLLGAPWPPCLESLARTEESPNNSPPLACLGGSGRGSVWDTAHMATAEAVAALEPKLLLGAEVAAQTTLGLKPSLFWESSEAGPRQGSTRGSLGTTALSAAPRQQGWETSLAQAGTLTSHPNGPSPLPPRL